MHEIFIRPLNLNDASISYKWRNNPKIWIYTKFTCLKNVTPSIEREWLSKCLQRTDEFRFAICLKGSNQYIGNVQLIGVRNKSADFHMFIGEEQFWRKGIGRKATSLMLEYGFQQLNLKTITLLVHKENIAAQTIYLKMGFKPLSSSENFSKMVLSEAMYKKCLGKIKQREGILKFLFLTLNSFFSF